MPTAKTSPSVAMTKFLLGIFNESEGFKKFVNADWETAALGIEKKYRKINNWELNLNLDINELYNYFFHRGASR